MEAAAMGAATEEVTILGTEAAAMEAASEEVTILGTEVAAMEAAATAYPQSIPTVTFLELVSLAVTVTAIPQAEVAAAMEAATMQDTATEAAVEAATILEAQAMEELDTE
jgi:hypothetical protein